jgi:hypothetical protein
VGHTVIDPGVRRFEIDPEWPHGYHKTKLETALREKKERREANRV